MTSKREEVGKGKPLISGKEANRALGSEDPYILKGPTVPFID